MFYKNDEFEESKDDIVTDEGVADRDTNNGYILGMPFLRAYMIFMDFEQNKIGFANKKYNDGAFITNDFLDNKGLPEIIDEHRHRIKSDRTAIGDDDTPSGSNVLIIVSASMLLMCTLCLVLYYCVKRR